MKILLIGIQPPPITGNGLVNKHISKYLPIYYRSCSVNLINTGYPIYKQTDIGKLNIKKVFHHLKQYKDIYKIRNADKIYMAIGLTFFGVLKYAPFFLFSKFMRKEIIIHIHSNHLWKEYELLKGFKKKIFHRIISMTNKGIVLSESLEKNLLPFIQESQIYILENFVEDYIFDSCEEKKIDKLRVIFLSNLILEKGIIDFFESLLILKNEGINFKVKIAGTIDPSMQNTINKYLNKLSDHVKYLGVVYNEQKKAMLEWGNVFVLPTYYAMEGQPISIFEAMATANIILTTKHAGIPDVFKDGINGFYIDKKSPKSIANKLLTINENIISYQKITKHNKQEAKQKYRLQRFIEKLYIILQD